MHTFLVPLLLLPSVLSKIKVERKDFFVKKGNTEVFDETVKTNPRSFDYDFADDLRHQANRNDIPLVTREVRTWSTPAPVLDSFPYYTRSTPFRTRTTSAPFIGNVQRFIPNREPVMLEADEVKRVRELLAGGSAEVPPTSPTSNTITTSSSTTTTTLATTTTKKLAVVQAEAPKKMEKFPTSAPTSTTSTTEIPTTTAAKPIKVKQPLHTEVKEVKKLKELPTKSPVTTKSSARSATVATAVPPTASSAARTTKKFTPSKKSTTTSSPSTTSTARTTTVTITRRASAKVLTTTPTSSVATTEPTQHERPVWRPNRPAQPQPPFKFATVMGVRREGIRTTASPRPGGIWRRGKVIFEDSTTTTTVPSTTNKPTVAYSTDRQSATHRSDEKRYFIRIVSFHNRQKP
ncbi:hypothetical protein GCK32_017947 [Trichostrongylus colubriformis]|uniref:Uncharacterized protein n=1 Tax=Trichostrongylus colubriformis TaxID=6319 RepID=A0AAN8IUH9_TRICO